MPPGSTPPTGSGPDTPSVGPPSAPATPSFPAIPAGGDKERFKSARRSFSRFASSGGSDRRSLGRSISRYVSTAAGGSRVAAQRMGASRQTSATLASFLSSAAVSGPREALRVLRLESLAGRPIEEIFLGMMDYVCPEGGSIDDSIARDAFIETTADLADNGLTDFDTLNAAQLQTVLELYATHAIEARLCNDIGTKAVSLPSNTADAERVQAQLFDFIRRSVSDALTAGLAEVATMTPVVALGYVTLVYEQAFTILQSLGEAAEVEG
jgi:hypothetical protein